MRETAAQRSGRRHAAVRDSTGLRSAVVKISNVRQRYDKCASMMNGSNLRSRGSHSSRSKLYERYDVSIQREMGYEEDLPRREDSNLVANLTGG